MYSIRGDELHLVRTGSHSDLFDAQIRMVEREGLETRARFGVRSSVRPLVPVWRPERLRPGAAGFRRRPRAGARW